MPSLLKMFKLQYHLWRCEKLLQKAEKYPMKYEKLRHKIMEHHKRAKELYEELKL